MVPDPQTDPTPASPAEPETVAPVAAVAPSAASPELEPEPFAERPARAITMRRVLLGAAGLVALYLLVQLLTWPDVAALAKENPRSTAFIEAWQDDQADAGNKGAKADWRWVPAARISSAMKRAVVCGEDMEFFSHQGFSEHEMREAFKDAFEDGKKLRGASTISQQLAKNLWLSPSRNPLRKVKEAILTKQLEKNLPKGRILELYLNVAEFGPGVYGVEAAARRYFGVSAAGLDEAQAAALAAGLPSPARWNPSTNSRTARNRANIIRARMAEAGWLRQLV